MPTTRKPDTRGLADYALSTEDKLATIKAVDDELTKQKTEGAFVIQRGAIQTNRIVAAVWEALAELQISKAPYAPFKSN